MTSSRQTGGEGRGPRRRAGSLPALVSVIALALCGSSLVGCTPGPAGSSTDQGLQGSRGAQTVTVLAAASLTDSFEAIAADLEAATPGTEVVLSFGSSSTLALQVRAGAPADVLATADPTTMATALDGLTLEGSGAAPSPVLFARNDLVIAVAPGNPLGITDLTDLAADGLVVSRCAPAVPCGTLADAALAAAGITLAGASEAPDVKAAFAPLVAGQVDAALVYRSDVVASTGADHVELAPAVAQTTAYPIASLTGSAVADAFVESVLSEAGAATLAEHGLHAP